MKKFKDFFAAHKAWILGIGSTVLMLLLVATSTMIFWQHHKASKLPTMENFTEETGTAKIEDESKEEEASKGENTTEQVAENTHESHVESTAQMSDTEEQNGQTSSAGHVVQTTKKEGTKPNKKPSIHTTKPRLENPKPQTTKPHTIKPQPVETTKPQTTAPTTDKVTTTKPGGPYEPWTPKPDPNFSEQAYAQKVLDMVNVERAKVGAGPLQFATDLQATADLRAREITQSFSHTRPDGTPCFTAFPRGYNYRGENIAYGYARPEMVMDGWMHSEGHKANILNPNYTYIGIGCYQKNGTLYWTQCFGASL